MVTKEGQLVAHGLRLAYQTLHMFCWQRAFSSITEPNFITGFQLWHENLTQAPLIDEAVFNP